MQARSSRALAAWRGAAAALLALFVAGAAVTAGAAQPPAKQSDKKESDKKDKPPEVKWPTDINGKDIHAVMKDMEDPDPVIREFAARTLPMFGPPAQEEKVSKLLLKRIGSAGSPDPDPGVRVAVFNTIGQIQFKDERDNKEALRLLTQYIDRPVGSSASVYRLHAIQTVTLFGPKGEGAITALTGQALGDPSYETRRSIANALGRVGFNETTGPNMKALTALANVLAKDPSASVRMEAMQSLMLLGPPWAAVMKAGAKMPPPIKEEDAAKIVKFMKDRVGDPGKKSHPAEKDKQVEIWARLVLMRFDPREVNEDNLDALAKYLTGAEPAVKVQALNAIGIIGELAAKKLKDVVRVLEEKNAPFNQTVACIQVLMSMGAGAKPAIPNLQTMLEARRKDLKEKELALAKKRDDPQLTAEKFALEELVKLLERAIEHIEKAKPTSPAGTSSDPPPKKG